MAYRPRQFYVLKIFCSFFGTLVFVANVLLGCAQQSTRMEMNVNCSWSTVDALVELNRTLYLQVKVLMGEDREMCGKMLSVEGRDAVIKQENPDVIKVVPWQFLCRMAPGVRT